MSVRPVDLLLVDIWEAIEKIEQYTDKLDHDSFIVDDKTLDAVVRNLEVIGEASNRLPEDFKSQHGDLEWRRIVGLRHRIVHDYFGIDLEIIWQILQEDLPTFKQRLADLRNDLSA